MLTHFCAILFIVPNRKKINRIKQCKLTFEVMFKLQSVRKVYVSEIISVCFKNSRRSPSIILQGGGWQRERMKWNGQADSVNIFKENCYKILTCPCLRWQRSLWRVSMWACVGRAGNHGEEIMFITTTSCHCWVVYHLLGCWKSMQYSRWLNELIEIH